MNVSLNFLNDVFLLICIARLSSCNNLNLTFRFGVGDFDWAEFTPRLKQKTYEEIKEYVVHTIGFIFAAYIPFTFHGPQLSEFVG